jgi:Mrp family chromosome partitioning ATPase
MEHIQLALDKAKERYGAPLRPVETVRPGGADLGLLVRPGFANAQSWSRLPTADLQMAHLVHNRIITADRSSPAYSAFDRLRTKILHEMRERNWTSVAITSPTAGCGKSVVALNLAFSFGHQDECRTVAIDLDLAQTRMADLLGMDRASPMADFLAGRRPAEAAFVRHGPNLAFGANSQPVSFTAELLQSASTTRVLTETCRELQANVVIYDMPPMLCGDDVMAFLPRVDCVVLVAAAEISSFAEIDLCERELSEKSNLLGVVLNRCRYPQGMSGY